MEYTTKGTCSRKILFEVEDGKVHNVQFVGGCNGNTQGVARLVEGMDVNEAISRMKGIDCNGRGTFFFYINSTVFLPATGLLYLSHLSQRLLI